MAEEHAVVAVGVGAATDGEGRAVPTTLAFDEFDCKGDSSTLDAAHMEHDDRRSCALDHSYQFGSKNL